MGADSPRLIVVCGFMAHGFAKKGGLKQMHRCNPELGHGYVERWSPGPGLFRFTGVGNLGARNLRAVHHPALQNETIPCFSHPIQR